jgi:hypothetical protein
MNAEKTRSRQKNIGHKKAQRAQKKRKTRDSSYAVGSQFRLRQAVFGSTLG